MKDFFYNFCRCIKWLPILWKDRWWDSSFLLRIMEFKLRQDADRYDSKWAHLQNADKRAKQMRICAALLKRLQDNDYTTPWDKEFHDYVDRHWNYIERNEEVLANGDSVYSDEGFQRTRREELVSKWYRNRTKEMEDQDLNLLLKIFKTHLKGWWDVIIIGVIAGIYFYAQSSYGVLA